MSQIPPVPPRVQNRAEIHDDMMIKSDPAWKGGAGLQNVMERKQEKEAGRSNFKKNGVLRTMKLNLTSVACLD